RNIVWNTTAVPDGNHTLTTTVTDSSGRQATVSVTVSVSNNPLPTFITAPTAGSTVNGDIPVDVWVEQSTDNSNYFTLAVDGTVILSQTTSGAHATFWPWNTTTVSNGAHTLTATVTDATGRSGRVSQNVTVSNP